MRQPRFRSIAKPTAKIITVAMFEQSSAIDRDPEADPVAPIARAVVIGEQHLGEPERHRETDERDAGHPQRDIELRIAVADEKRCRQDRDPGPNPVRSMSTSRSTAVTMVATIATSSNGR